MDLPIDLSEIVRIEVLEGPAGRIYGSSSLVGAINIVTRPAPATSADVTVEGGSYGYGKVSARANLRQGSWNNQVSAGYNRSDGYSRSKAGTLNTDFSGSKAFYQGQYADNDVRIRWHLGIADKGWGSSTFYASPKWQADDQYEHTTKLYSAIQAETSIGKLRLMPSIYWNQNYDRYEGYRNHPEKMKYNYNRTDIYGINLSSYFDWAAGRTAFGAEIRNEDLMSGNLGEPLSEPHAIKGTNRDYTLGLNRTNISGYLEHNLLLEHLTVSAGLVAVKNTWSNMNMTIYPGIDVSYRPDTHWTLHASYNTSLRMPSFTEMYYKLQGYAADPHLKPEEMQAFEAGAQYSQQTLTISATLWHHRGRNMIDWIMDTSLGDEAVWQSVNHTKVNSLGFEVKAQLSILNSQFSASYSYIDQDKEQEPNIVSQYALEYLRHKFVANALFPLWKQLTLGLNFRWQDRVGQYTDFDGIVQDYLPYALVDARLSWQQKKWKLYLEANNLFDKDYVDFGHVEEPGRWLIVGMNLSL
jgi:iron complex outermembrane receptor protein